jgi:hypothetical protein
VTVHVWQCKDCGYQPLGRTAPVNCPQCRGDFRMELIPGTAGPCLWPMSHRNKHNCGCTCALDRGHKGKHRCALEVDQ